MKIRQAWVLLSALPFLSFAQSKAPVFPLKISQNRHYFEDQNGQPFLLFSDSPWELFTMTTKAEAAEYLETRKGQGFNAVTVTLAPGLVNSRTKEGKHLAFVPEGKLDRPNEEYLKHVEWVIDKAAEKGMLVLLISFWSGCCPQEFHYWWPHFTEEVARPFGVIVGERFKNKQNVLWIHGGDRRPGDRADLFRDLANGIDSKGTYLQTYFGLPYNPEYPDPAFNFEEESSSAFYHNDAWLDFNTVVSWSDRGYVQVLKDYYQTPRKPVYFGRGKFEGEYAPPLKVRSQAYYTLLSGAAGYCYGNVSWHFHPGWQKWLHSPGTKVMGHVKKLFVARPWYQLVPDDHHELVMEGAGTPGLYGYVPAAQAADGSFAVAYLPAGSKITVNLEKLAGKEIKAGWYNPREGSYREIGKFEKKGAKHFTSPDLMDWVLVLEDSSRNLPAL